MHHLQKQSERKEGEWLSDEHINHAQGLLAKQCPQIDGLQAPSIFCPEGCQNVGTPKKNLPEITGQQLAMLALEMMRP